MPTVGVQRDLLFRAIGQTFTDEEFDHLCFAFGIELDDITSERQLKEREASNASTESSVGLYSDAVLYKIDVPANRVDILCVEGLARALRVFLDLEKPPIYSVAPPCDVGKVIEINVNAATSLVRPYVVAAVLRGIEFTKERYESFIDLQDKLHQNICRRRTLVAIGTHDLDSVEAPFIYTALPPDQIQFIPLAQTKSMDAKSLLDMYRTSPEFKHLRPYTDIIYDKPVYPVVMDRSNTILSLPPIINGEHSKITCNTRNVLIECTATDITKARVVLNTMVTMFSQYTSPKPFMTEAVQVNYEENAELNGKSPNLDSREVCVATRDINSMIFGKAEPIDLGPERLCKLCLKMQLDATLSNDQTHLVVQIPPTRSDILHPIDVIEDVSIAYGFNNIPHTLPKVQSTGEAQPLNKLTEQLREEVSRAGYMELLTHGLCSHDENFKFLNLSDEKQGAVVLKNPATIEFEIVRTSLMPGILKTIQSNKSMSFKEGIKLFEISDVVILDTSSDVGAKNVRRICAAYTGLTDGFEKIHGLVDRIMLLLGYHNLMENAEEISQLPEYYSVIPSIHPTYFPGRCADVILHKTGLIDLKLGTFGVLHPKVLRNFELAHPTSILEMNLEPLV